MSTTHRNGAPRVLRYVATRLPDGTPFQGPLASLLYRSAQQANIKNPFWGTSQDFLRVDQSCFIRQGQMGVRDPTSGDTWYNCEQCSDPVVVKKFMKRIMEQRREQTEKPLPRSAVLGGLFEQRWIPALEKVATEHSYNHNVWLTSSQLLDYFPGVSLVDGARAVRLPIIRDGVRMGSVDLFNAHQTTEPARVAAGATTTAPTARGRFLSASKGHPYASAVQDHIAAALASMGRQYLSPYWCTPKQLDSFFEGTVRLKPGEHEHGVEVMTADGKPVTLFNADQTTRPDLVATRVEIIRREQIATASKKVPPLSIDVDAVATPPAEGPTSPTATTDETPKQ